MPEMVLIEAEAFAEAGGWAVDQQCLDAMGSPYLLAHGLGRPVADAVTTVRFAAPGTSRVIHGNWDFLRNRSRHRDQYALQRLAWVACIGDKRESRRLLGDLMLCQQDLEQATRYPDACIAVTLRQGVGRAAPQGCG